MKKPVKRRPSVLKRLLGLVMLLFVGAAVVGGVALYTYASHLDGVIRSQFEGKRWALPARVYARPLEVFPSKALNPDAFAQELGLSSYRQVAQDEGPGTYVRVRDAFELSTRGFAFWDGVEEPRRVRVSFNAKAGTVAGIAALDGKPEPGLLRFEPAEIAGIYPKHHEDRVLVRRDELPKPLLEALLAVEDRSFYEHFGIDPKGVARAALANLRAGRTVQGASTLTQQLVKNFFLSNERTLTRKLNEALMAVLLELHYSKDEILEAYSNEIYLGQDGSRAIHGFGLAARFYFDRPLAELELPHAALLVGLVKGPSYYDPRRHPERASARRAVVLDAMVAEGFISPEQAAAAKAAPLGVGARPASGVTPYPAYLDLVQRQLRESYREEDLTSEGLKIFTTLDPRLQEIAERTVSGMLPTLEKGVKLKPETLQGAAMIADPDTGEVLALVGGRDVRLAGFNRVLDARRPAGSTLKPAVYLTALEEPARFTLATRLDDGPFSYQVPGGPVWSPSNYDRRHHGSVMLRDALARSYNIPTVRLGLDVGVARVVAMLKRLGVRQDLAPYPSVLLGAADLTPFEIAQMYQTLASGGFRAPLRAIREVTTQDGRPLTRYPLAIEMVVEPGPAYLIRQALQAVVREGTAAGGTARLDRKLNLAGKTGTTDDLRDSWFAGFSGNLMTVVWLGRDDNKPTGLSGSTGALKVWAELMRQLPLEPVDATPPPGIQTALVDRASGLLADGHCPGALSLPFIAGSAPRVPAPCNAAYAPPAYAGEEVVPSAEGGWNPQAPAPTPTTKNDDPISDFFKRLMQ